MRCHPYFHQKSIDTSGANPNLGIRAGLSSNAPAANIAQSPPILADGTRTENYVQFLWILHLPFDTKVHNKGITGRTLATQVHRLNGVFEEE
jgi:hypothetical protein